MHRASQRNGSRIQNPGAFGALTRSGRDKYVLTHLLIMFNKQLQRDGFIFTQSPSFPMKSCTQSGPGGPCALRVRGPSGWALGLPGLLLHSQNWVGEPQSGLHTHGASAISSRELSGDRAPPAPPAPSALTPAFWVHWSSSLPLWQALKPERTLPCLFTVEGHYFSARI